MLARLTALTLALGPTAQDASPPALEMWRNFNQTFQLELPAGWRQIAPNEAIRIAEDPASPFDLRFSQPTGLYAVGPVDRWLEGDYAGPMLVVREQDSPWYVDEDYAQVLRQSWTDHGEANGLTHEVTGIHKETFGKQDVECIVATRTSTPPPPAPVRRALDVHAPTAQQQITLSFVCAPDRFEALEPSFREWLRTLTFARVSRGQQSLGDRLWTPLLVGGLVGAILLVLYKHTRARR